ncbi:MAG: tryptophan-rich sensory protein [Eudoraea sp.]|nr:tryptophan-rich sensory protein [Eudoraea sp.]
MKNKILKIAIAIIICLVVGFLSSFATQSSVNDWYLSLNKPSFNPPNWIFAPVWSILYLTMGIAAGLVWAEGWHKEGVKVALYFFGFQLLFNGLWSVTFFGFRNPFWALLVILVLLALILRTIKSFRSINITSAYLLIPYFVWVSFATLLNYKIWELN